MTALREKSKLEHELSCSRIGDKVRLLGRWLLKTAEWQFNASANNEGLECAEEGCTLPGASPIGWTRIEPSTGRPREKMERSRLLLLQIVTGEHAKSHVDHTPEVLLMGAWVCGWTCLPSKPV
eukprot:2220097-Amphidinium_carterae.2